MNIIITIIIVHAIWFKTSQGMQTDFYSHNQIEQSNTILTNRENNNYCENNNSEDDSCNGDLT